jgi:hypothetical protein
MSLFDKDIVSKDLGYSPYVVDNVGIQIQQEFNRLVDVYMNEPQLTSPPAVSPSGFLSYVLDQYMSNLCTEPTPPTDWKGPFANLIEYDICKEQDNSKPLIQEYLIVSYRLRGNLQLQHIVLQIPEETLDLVAKQVQEFREKYKELREKYIQ